MRLENIFISLLGLLLGFALLAVGGYLFFTPYIVAVDEAVQALALRKDLLSLGGFGLVVVGSVFLLLFFLASRRRYVLLRMGGASIQDRVIAHFAKQCLQNLFPSQKVACDVVIHKKGRVEIVAAIPAIKEEEQEHTFKKIEEALVIALADTCGIKGPFLLNLSFNQ